MINIAVEGESDVEAARAIVSTAGHSVGRIVPARGKSRLDPKIEKYAQASAQTPWIVFRDSDGECPVELRERLFPHSAMKSQRFLLRIAHTMTEAWLLADRAGFSDYFGVPKSSLPTDVESVSHAKNELLRLCSRSRSRAIRREVIARDSGAGPLYVFHLNAFASESWSVADAALNSPSLARSLRRIAELPGE